MSWKILLPILASAMRKRHNLTDTVAISSALLKQALQEVIMLLAIKIMFGLVLCALLIMSLVMVGQQVNTMLLSMPDGPLMSLILFGILGIACVGGLIYVFKPKDTVSETPSAQMHIDMPKVAGNFYQGLMEGLETSRHARQTSTPQNGLHYPSSYGGQLPVG